MKTALNALTDAQFSALEDSVHEQATKLALNLQDAAAETITAKAAGQICLTVLRRTVSFEAPAAAAILDHFYGIFTDALETRGLTVTA